jgi:signal transduction histidine kinase
VQLTVRDSGVGLDAKALERIFVDFERVDSGPNRAKSGPGLGLAVSRRLVRLHGGRIWAESKGAGHGSAFHVVIPADCRPVDESPPA